MFTSKDKVTLTHERYNTILEESASLRKELDRIRRFHRFRLSDDNFIAFRLSDVERFESFINDNLEDRVVVHLKDGYEFMIKSNINVFYDLINSC